MHTRGSNRVCPFALLLVLAAGMIGGVTSAALGQNALGDGRGMEKDLRKGGTGNTPRANFREEVARRNALVTGQLGGGKSFRGSVGYTAPGDFRGTTAGDSTFAFRRDSMSGRGVSSAVRGTDSLRYQYLYSTGNVRTLDRLTDKSAGVSISGASGAGSRSGADTAEGRGLVTRDQGAMRSTSMYTANRDLRPGFLGYKRSATGESDTLTVSPLLGVKQIPSVEKKRPLNSAAAESAQAKPATFRSSYDGVRARLDLFAGPRPAEPDAGKPEDQQIPSETKPVPGETKPVGADDKASTPARSEWEERLEKLRAGIGGDPESKNKEAAPRFVTEAKPTEYVPGAWRDAAKTRDEERKQATVEVDPRALEIIRAAGGMVGSLGFGDEGVSDPFELHMRWGQILLQDQRYFDAEERFARALTYKQGDLMAMVGRIHAEIGAGLNVSAALNLQELLTQHPELIAVRYTGGSIPNLARLKVQADLLRLRIDDAAKLGIDPNHDISLLLAYVGYQADLPGDIGKGLDAFERVASPSEKNLVVVLREVWLKPPAAPLELIQPPAPSSGAEPSK
ncbi:MAG: hypothetical protein ACOYN0_05515 [Phycisphaerales bacterium]